MWHSNNTEQLSHNVPVLHHGDTTFDDLCVVGHLPIDLAGCRAGKHDTCVQIISLEANMDL